MVLDLCLICLGLCIRLVAKVTKAQLGRYCPNSPRIKTSSEGTEHLIVADG